MRICGIFVICTTSALRHVSANLTKASTTGEPAMSFSCSQQSPNVEIFKYLISIVDLNHVSSRSASNAVAKAPFLYLITSTAILPTYSTSTLPQTLSESHYESLHQKPPQLARSPQSNSPPPSPLQNNVDCLHLGSALNACESRMPGFTSALPSSQAECLCYSASSWRPDVFDQAVDGCAKFASTAAPIAYGPLVALGGFCTGVGDVRGVTAGTSYVGGGGEGNGLASVSITRSTLNTASITTTWTEDRPQDKTSRTSTSRSLLTTTTFPPSTTSAADTQTPFSSVISTPSITPSTTSAADVRSNTFSHTPTLSRATSSVMTTRVTAPHPLPTDQLSRARRATGEWEIIWVSFCCAMVVLFL